MFEKMVSTVSIYFRTLSVMVGTLRANGFAELKDLAVVAKLICLAASVKVALAV